MNVDIWRSLGIASLLVNVLEIAGVLLTHKYGFVTVLPSILVLASFAVTFSVFHLGCWVSVAVFSVVTWMPVVLDGSCVILALLVTAALSWTCAREGYAAALLCSLSLMGSAWFSPQGITIVGALNALGLFFASAAFGCVMSSLSRSQSYVRKNDDGGANEKIVWYLHNRICADLVGLLSKDVSHDLDEDTARVIEGVLEKTRDVISCITTGTGCDEYPRRDEDDLSVLKNHLQEIDLHMADLRYEGSAFFEDCRDSGFKQVPDNNNMNLAINIVDELALNIVKYGSRKGYCIAVTLYDGCMKIASVNIVNQTPLGLPSGKQGLVLIEKKVISMGGTMKVHREDMMWIFDITIPYGRS
ncbi:hypothetical protein [Bifidobacterium samirii]|nr:hypothetical protein [Bifidobacterium samirii]